MSHIVAGAFSGFFEFGEGVNVKFWTFVAAAAIITLSFVLLWLCKTVKELAWELLVTMCLYTHVAVVRPRALDGLTGTHRIYKICRSY